MATFILILHLFIALAMVGTVLLQRSEGGALGIGGGGGFMTGRGAANAMTRATAVLALLFFITSIFLTVIAGGGAPSSVLDVTPGSESPAPLLSVPAPSETPTPQP